MSLLALQLPPRHRLGPHIAQGDGAPEPGLPTRWAYCFSADGQRVGPMGHAALADLPKAEQTVLVVAAADVSWHRVRLPKAAPARMRQALAGVLEEHLLEEDDAVHLALAPDAAAGQEGWVAATHGPRLQAALAQLEAAGLRVARVVPALPAPGGALRGHFADTEQAGVGHAATRGITETPAPRGAATNPAPRGAVEPASTSWLSKSRNAAAGAPQGAFFDTEPQDPGTLTWSLSTDAGAWHLPLFERATKTSGGGLAVALRNTLPPASNTQRWTATPAAAAAAEKFLGRPVLVQTTAEHLLELALSPTNLRQFDLAPRHRGFAALGHLVQRLRSSEWRTVRWGLAALMVLHVVGINLAAWSQQRELQARRAAITQLLRSTYPQVQTVLDAPVQMRAETERLRAAAGRPGPADLEAALAQAATAWPAGKPAVTALRFEPGRLSITSPGWNEAEVAALRERLSPGGWSAAYADGQVTLTRGAAR